MLSRRRIIGLAVAGRSITAVELAALNGGAQAHRTAVFELPEDVNLSEPQRLGKLLKQFLRTNGFSASQCAIGLDARLLTAREKPLPPGVGSQASQVLALAAEREFASDRKNLVVDYALAPADSDNARALLVAAPRQTVGQLSAMAQAAGLKPKAITSSTLVLAEGHGEHAPANRLVMRLFAEQAELLTKTATGGRTMRPLSVAASSGDDSDLAFLDRVSAELRRVVMLLPSCETDGDRRKLTVWDDRGLDPAARDRLAEMLDLSVTVVSVPHGVHTNGLAKNERRGQFCAASAVALAVLRKHPLPVDFLHSRLAAPRKRMLTRKVAWATVAGIAALLVLGMLAWQWRQDEIAIADLTREAAVLRPQIEQANAVIDRTRLARTWHDRRPMHLECVRQIAEAFPSDGRIWTRSVTVQPELDKSPGRGGSSTPRNPARLSVTVTGFAVDRKAALDVLDRLNANPRMTNVQSEGLRSTGKGGREESFSMSFTFDGAN